MKKLTYLFAGLIMVALVVSCSKEATDDTGVNLKDAVIDKQSLPVSDDGNGVTPVILAVDKPKGGNVTCSDVAQAYVTSFDLCGDKLDYDGMQFNGTFPLNVTVEGVFVSFSTEGGNCIQIGDKFYKVGAVIVKGGNAANVYFYEGGTLSDSGLASPINASGQPAALSNLTFCFVECEFKEPVVIAVKGNYTAGSTSTYYNAGQYSIYWSYGEVYEFTGCPKLGYSTYPNINSFDLRDNGIPNNIGTVLVTPGINTLIVTITLKDDGILDNTYLYVGSLEGLRSTVINACPAYSTSTLWKFDGTNANSVTFVVPY